MAMADKMKIDLPIPNKMWNAIADELSQDWILQQIKTRSQNAR